MVLDDQIWKLTFHAQAWHLETGPDGKYRCNLATALPQLSTAEKFKQVLAKALNLILDGGSQSPQIARPLCPLLGLTYFKGC